MKVILQSIIFSTLIPTQIWGSSVTGRKDLAANKPNVILVLTDDQGYGDLSCHGLYANIALTAKGKVSSNPRLPFVTKF
jgi:hypothetical protein